MGKRQAVKEDKKEKKKQKGYPNLIIGKGRVRGSQPPLSKWQLQEVSRLVVQGKPIKFIASELNVCRERIGQLIKEAESKGIIQELSARRDNFTIIMGDKLQDMALNSAEIIQYRLDLIKGKIDDAPEEKPYDPNARDMNDTFRALDKSEPYVMENKTGKIPGGINIAIFTPEALEQADKTSNRIFDVKSENINE